MAEYKYPPVGFHFRVQFDGISATDDDTRFMEVSGLEATVETESLKAGGENRFQFALPNGITYSKLRLKRGLIKDTGVTKWVRNAIENFEFKPVSITVTLLNEKHEPLQAWYVVSAYPTAWKISGFNAMENQLVTEELELYYQYFKIL